MADRPTLLFAGRTASPPDTWKTRNLRFHKQQITPPQQPTKPGKKKTKRAIQEIIVSQPIPYWFDHLHAMREMLGCDVPASTLNKGCQTKFMPTTEQEFEVLWDYLTKNEINIVWPPHNRPSEQQPSAPPTPKTKLTVAHEQPKLALTRRDTATSLRLLTVSSTHSTAVREDEPRSFTYTDAKNIGKSDARRIAVTHSDPATTGEGDTRRLAAEKASTLPDT
ncbi:hypothetical protein ACJJTC_016561 [Scirpophaga incertulas]